MYIYIRDGSTKAPPPSEPPAVRGGTGQGGASHNDGQVRACDLHATCLHSVLRSVLRREERGKGRAGREGPDACLRHACDLPTKCPA